MGRSEWKCALVVGLIAVLVMGLALPGQAAYSKLYRFKTDVRRFSVRAVTQGLEAIDHDYAFPSAWAPAAQGFMVPSGVYCTTLSFGGVWRSAGKTVKIGWETVDGSCRLRDLRWGDGTAIVNPEVLGGVPGGGMVFYDWPVDGDLTVVITNDNEDPNACISLADIEFGISDHQLSLAELDALLGTGLVEMRVASIDDDIDVLRAEVEDYGAVGGISGPSANSLLRKLERAAAYKHDGLDEYFAGDPDGALTFWARAAKQMTNFISEVTASAQKGNLELDTYNRWVVDGDGDIVPSSDVREALLALPEGQALQSLEGLSCEDVPPHPGLDSLTCVGWPAYELCPGEFTAFVVPQVAELSGFIMGGSVVDEDADSVVLEWTEQSVAEVTVPTRWSRSRSM
jgi:hypothetical protein